MITKQSTPPSGDFALLPTLYIKFSIVVKNVFCTMVVEPFNFNTIMMDYRGTMMERQIISGYCNFQHWHHCIALFTNRHNCLDWSFVEPWASEIIGKSYQFQCSDKAICVLRRFDYRNIDFDFFLSYVDTYSLPVTYQLIFHVLLSLHKKYGEVTIVVIIMLCAPKFFVPKEIH